MLVGRRSAGAPPLGARRLLPARGARGNGGGSFAYSNRQLAPLTLSLAASAFSFADTPPVLNSATDPPRGLHAAPARQRAQPSTRCGCSTTTRSRVGFSFDRDLAPRRSRRAHPAAPDRRPARVGDVRRRGDVAVHGASRLFFASIDAAAYPRDWNSAGFGFYDLRGELAAIVPLPFYRRHTLTLDVRGARSRRLARGRTPAARRRLRPAAARAHARTARGARRPTTRSCRRARCSSNRCAASRTIRSRSTGSASAAPATGCRSSSTTAGPRRCVVLPALFIQQIDFDLFAVAASDGRTAASTPPRVDRCRCSWRSGSSRSPSSTSSPAGSPTTRRWSTWSRSALLSAFDSSSHFGALAR